MNPITPMEAYATTDGKLHMDALDALAHQHGLDIIQEVEEHLGDYRVLLDGSRESMPLSIGKCPAN